MFSSNTSQVSSDATYIEDVFSTYLYTGTGSTQTITNGIDFTGKGGMLWIKTRSTTYNHALFDTARTSGRFLSSNTTSAEGGIGGGFALGSSGFNVNGATLIGESAQTYSSWTFRKQPKFFDVVTYTGDGTAGRTIAHNLGSVPGCIITKSTSGGISNWNVYHRSLGETKAVFLNLTNAENTNTAFWNNTAPTSTEFTVGTSSGANASGYTYVAYLFAHNAGGFGLTGTDNVISCGSFTTDSSGLATVNLGYEPQLILYKRTDSTGNWSIVDNMRGWAVGGNSQRLQANTADAEQTSGGGATSPTATGFTVNGGIPASATAIYIAIRRGPMKTPTTGTSVFAVDISNSSGSSTSPEFVSNFPVDMYYLGNRTNSGGADKWYWQDRLRGNVTLNSATTSAESALSVAGFAFNTGVFSSSITTDYYATMFRRAPGFFDEVCYTGTSSSNTINHNLGVVPELLIMKARNSADYPWYVHAASQGVGKFAYLGGVYGNFAFGDSGGLTSTSSTNFVLPGGGFNTNFSGLNYVAYMFASAPGVSKVGSYTGTGAAQTINCGFTAGARFVLIKRTDSTGDWYVWDTARGIVSGNDPYLLLNSTAAEVTTTDYIDPVSSGFEISSTAPAAINASGGTFIYLAIA